MDKAVVLAAGLGKRMRRRDESTELTAAQRDMAATGIKALVPVGRPFLDYGLSALADAGYRQVCLVIGPDHGVLRQYYSEQVECRRLQISFALQAQPLGTADAVAAAADFVGDDPFLALNSDNIYPTEALRLMRGLAGPGLAVFERESLLKNSNIPADRVRRYALVQTDGDGYLQRIMEKPKPEEMARLPQPLGVSMNCWRFDRRIFKACRAIPLSARGELELPDAVQYAAGHLDVRFQAPICYGPVLDLSSQEDVSSVAPYLADREVVL